MEPSDVMDSSAKENLLFALKDRLSYVLHMEFLPGITSKKLRKEKRQRAAIYNVHLATSELLPTEYFDCEPDIFEHTVLSTHRFSSGSELGTNKGDACVIAYTKLQELPKPSEGPIPYLLAFVPARFLAALNLDVETLCRIAQDTKDPYHDLVNDAESILKEELTLYPSPIPDIAIATSPVVLFTAIKIVFDLQASAVLSMGREVHLLRLIIGVVNCLSRQVWNEMTEKYQQEISVWHKGTLFIFSMKMDIWGEEYRSNNESISDEVRALCALLDSFEHKTSNTSNTTEYQND